MLKERETYKNTAISSRFKALHREIILSLFQTFELFDSYGDWPFVPKVIGGVLLPWYKVVAGST